MLVGRRFNAGQLLVAKQKASFKFKKTQKISLDADTNAIKSNEQSWKDMFSMATQPHKPALSPREHQRDICHKRFAVR